MRLLLDMGVDARAAIRLREQGHDAIHLREQGLQRMSDREIFAKCVLEDRIIVTYDLDFSEIATSSGRSDVRVISLRISDATLVSVLRHLEAVFASCAQQRSTGWIVTVEDTRHRVRSLPIGGE